MCCSRKCLPPLPNDSTKSKSKPNLDYWRWFYLIWYYERIDGKKNPLFLNTKWFVPPFLKGKISHGGVLANFKRKIWNNQPKHTKHQIYCYMQQTPKTVNLREPTKDSIWNCLLKTSGIRWVTNKTHTRYNSSFSYILIHFSISFLEI